MLHLDVQKISGTDKYGPRSDKKTIGIRIHTPGCKGARFSVGKYLFLIGKSPVPTNHLSLNPFNPTSELR